MAARLVHASVPFGRGADILRSARVTASPGVLVLAASLPPLFLHFGFQPSVAVRLGPATATAYLSDFAVLAVVLAAAAEWIRRGGQTLRDGRLLWLAGAALLAWVFVEVGYGRLHSPSYAAATHAVSAAKLAEYALLAPAVPLLVRTATDLLVVFWSLTLWSAAATIVGLLQFFGADIAGPGAVGQRQPSFLGEPDFAALSVGVLLLGAVAVLARRRELPRRLAATALASGGLGLVLAGAVAGVLGLATALVAMTVVLGLRGDLSFRRIAAVAAIGVLVAGAAVVIRAKDIQNFARFVGTAPVQETRSAHVQTYSQRTLLTWIGLEIWKQHPILGVGWQGSNEPADFEPILPAARRRFPSLAPLAFPSPTRRYGVQNAWVQSLADLGVVGFLLWVALFLTTGARSVRHALRSGSPLALCTAGLTAALVWLWAAANLVAGIPLVALTALTFGLAVTPVVHE